VEKRIRRYRRSVMEMLIGVMEEDDGRFMEGVKELQRILRGEEESELGLMIDLGGEWL
jgi:predicted sugar kinase